MSGYIGDQETSAVEIDGDEPVKISCHGCHRTIRRADPQISEFGNTTGEDRSLYHSGDGEFIFNGSQTPLIGENLVGCHETQKEDKHREAKRLDGRIRGQMERVLQIIVEGCHSHDGRGDCEPSALKEHVSPRQTGNGIYDCERYEKADHYGSLQKLLKLGF